MVGGKVFVLMGVNLHHGPTRRPARLAVNMKTGIVASIPCILAGHGENPAVTASSLDKMPGVYALSENSSFGRQRGRGHRLEEKDSSSC